MSDNQKAVIFEAPEYDPNLKKYEAGKTVFLGGSISNAKDWQSVLLKQIDYLPIRIYNPRRKEFDLSDTRQSVIQVDWECVHLEFAKVVVFYFSEETMAPITLFELGKRLVMNYVEALQPHGMPQSIYIYCEPGYKRKWDVEYQTGLCISEFIALKLKEYNDSYHKGFSPPIKQTWHACEEDLKSLGGHVRHGYDVRRFDNYDLFLNQLRARLQNPL